MNKIIPMVIAGAFAAVIIIAVIGLSQNEITPPTPSKIQNNEKLGLVINPPTAETTLETINKIFEEGATTGIGRSNLYLFWNIIEPEKNQFNFKESDILMSFNKKNDFKVTLYFSIINGKTLGPFPNWIGNPNLSSINEEQLVNTLDVILTRYDIIDSVIISGETDSHFRYNENNLPVYRELFNGVYEKIKEKHPNIKMGNAFSLHGVLNKNLEHILQELSVGDFVGFTYFPVDSLNEITKNPTEAIADLAEAIKLVPEKNVAFFEVSWSTGEFVGGNEKNQSEFLELLFDFYHENESKIEFLTWYRQYDRPEGTCEIDPASIEGEISIGGGSALGSSEFVIERLSNYICNAGLIDVDGNPKPGWNIFKEQIQYTIP